MPRNVFSFRLCNGLACNTHNLLIKSRRFQGSFPLYAQLGNAFSLPLSMASAGEYCQLEGHQGEEGLHLLHGLYFLWGKRCRLPLVCRWWLCSPRVTECLLFRCSSVQHQPHDFYKLGTTWFISSLSRWQAWQIWFVSHRRISRKLSRGWGRNRRRRRNWKLTLKKTEFPGRQEMLGPSSLFPDKQWVQSYL